MKAFTKKILKKIYFAVGVSFLVAFLAWILFHSIFKANITFWTILLIKGMQVALIVIVEHIIRDTYYKKFLGILLRNLRKGTHVRMAIHKAKGMSGVRIFYVFAWLIALNMKREIRGKRHHSTSAWKKILGFISFGYYGKNIYTNLCRCFLLILKMFFSARLSKPTFAISAKVGKKSSSLYKLLQKYNYIFDGSLDSYYHSNPSLHFRLVWRITTRLAIQFGLLFENVIQLRQFARTKIVDYILGWFLFYFF